MAHQIQANGQQVPLYAAPQLNKFFTVLFSGLNDLTNATVDLVSRWQYRNHYRRELANLSPEMLRDIGLDSSIAMNEAKKPFWKA